MPSPHIITSPFCFNFLISSAFCFGNTFAITLSTPICFAIAFAVFSLSPVSITTSIFLFCSFLTISILSSFNTSFTPISVIKFWFSAINKILFPSETNSNSFCSCKIVILFSNINFLFPIRYLFSFIVALTPYPGIALKSAISSSSIFKLLASFTIALAIGCSDLFSILATNFIISFSGKLL